MPVPAAARAAASAPVLAALLAFCGPAWAQGTPPSQPTPPPAAQTPAARCQALLGRLPVSGLTTPTAEPLPDGGCRFTNLRFGSDRFGYQVPTITEHGVPPDFPSSPPSFPSGPLDVQLDAAGIFFSLHSGNARVDWLNRQQQIPFDATLDAAYDPAHGDLHLRKLALDGAGIGHVSLALEATGLYDATFPGQVQLRSVRLRLDSRRVLATFLLPPLSNMLPEADPDGAFRALKAQAVAGLRALLPMTRASTGTTDAVAAFLADVPHPTHVLDLSITATPSVSLDEITEATGDPSRIAGLLRKLTITATYTGEPH